MSPRPRPTRLDDELVERGLAPALEGARALISAGLVDVDGVRADRSDLPVGTATLIAVRGPEHPWASRGGLKLVAALDHFGIDCADRVALDAGASTGGFCSVLLARGIRCVYAVDVGRGQLLPSVANDPRVVVMDRTNLRTLESLAGEAPDLVTLDLSFISVRAVLPAVRRLAPNAEAVVLFKPQFEVARPLVGRGGIVEDAAGEAAARQFLSDVGGDGIAVRDEPLASPRRGAKGNREWLLHLGWGA